MVSYFDHCAGELIDELERLGLADDTVVLITSDHGEMLGEHGMWFKRTFFDPSARVPLVVAGPGVAGGVRGRQFAQRLLGPLGRLLGVIEVEVDAIVSVGKD